MKTNLKNFKGKKVDLKVRDATIKGKSIYKNIKTLEDSINYSIIDLPQKNTGLKNLMVALCTLHPGKINKEFRMTRGHKHKTEEVYIFLEGSGQLLIDKKKFNIKAGDIVTIPANKWHRTVNTGKKKLVFLNVFEKGHQHLAKY